MLGHLNLLRRHVRVSLLRVHQSHNLINHVTVHAIGRILMLTIHSIDMGPVECVVGHTTLPLHNARSHICRYYASFRAQTINIASGGCACDIVLANYLSAVVLTRHV